MNDDWEENEEAIATLVAMLPLLRNAAHAFRQLGGVGEAMTCYGLMWHAAHLVECDSQHGTLRHELAQAALKEVESMMGNNDE